MRIAADTNVLLRAVIGDDARQGRLAKAELEEAELVALPIPALCELVWVLSRGYKIPRPEIAETLRRLLDAENVEVDRPATEAGFAILEAGGDFADGVIAYEGSWLGADTFVSFDKKAIAMLQARGTSARRLR